MVVAAFVLAVCFSLLATGLAVQGLWGTLVSADWVPSWLAWFFPLRGRWLRYLLTGAFTAVVAPVILALGTLLLWLPCFAVLWLLDAVRQLA
jgi:hypothetical protein